MKFLKFSIVIFFLLSVSSAVATVYLSTLRENEKSKRVYLEGVKADLEKKIQALESEKADLSHKLAGLELNNQDLTKQAEEERKNYQHAMDLIRDKDLDLENLRREAEQAHKAFEDAQERNQELERILDELEVRMHQAEVQSAPPASDASYVEVNVAPISSAAVNSKPTPAATGSSATFQKTDPIKASVRETAKASEKKEVIQPANVSAAPKPPKKRRKFLFFGSSKNEPQKREETKKQEPSTVQTFKSEPVAVAPKLQERVVEKAARPAPVIKSPVPATAPVPKTESSVKATQTIAAGSILLVNRKYNFVVVNLGSKHGLGLDDILSVRQDGNEVAKARVEKLYEDYSAAYIVEEKSEQPIGEGDAVTAV